MAQNRSRILATLLAVGVLAIPMAVAPAAQATTPSTFSWTNPIGKYASLNWGLRSPNGVYTLTLQASDGNLVLRHSGKAIWASNTNTRPSDSLQFRTNGRMDIIDASGTHWSNYVTESGKHTYVLECLNSGNLVEYLNGAAIWSTGTSGK
jgi:hypothetical protein